MIGQIQALPRALLPAAAAFAVAELLAGIALGGFFHGLRAEPLLFIALRPWLLLIAVIWAARFPMRQRMIFYALALGGAVASETLFLLLLDARHVLPMSLRGLLAGALLALLLDVAVGAVRRRFGRVGTLAAAAVAAGLYLTPWALIPYDRLVLGSGEGQPAGDRPDLMLMTGLPIIWGEGGAFDPASRPAAAYRLLQRDFAVRPLDSLDAEALAGGRLLLLAQPRALAPEELAALDGWVRKGGRALILTDPALVWPSKLPLGDLRSPPRVGLLEPLLDHWGVALSLPAGPPLMAADLRTGAYARRVTLASPGELHLRTAACTRRESWLVRCRLGRGEALILADADLLHNAMWAGAGGEGRDHRLADNPIVVAELLDGLIGLDRSRGRPPVDWLPIRYDASRAAAFALFPIALIIAAAIAFGRRRPRG